MEEKRVRTGDRATTESPRKEKSPRMGAPPVMLDAGEPRCGMETLPTFLEADDSECGGAASLKVSGSRDTLIVAIRDTDGKQCEHMICTEHDMEEVVSKIASSKGELMCEDETCLATGRHLMMVCSECDCHVCIGRSANKAKPQGHIREHALLDGHWVALCQDPYVGYCFECEESLTIGAEVGEKGVMVSREEGYRASGFADEHGFVIRGILNLGNTCYLNALLQCLLVLGKLRTWMCGPDAPSGILGEILRDLFVQTNKVGDTQGLLDPTTLLGCARMYESRFEDAFMQYSHELLCFLRLDKEEKMTMPGNVQQHAPSAVVPTVIDSIFGGQLSVTTSCNRCLFKSVSQDVFHNLSVPLPPSGTLSKIVMSPPRNKICVSVSQQSLQLVPEIDKASTEKFHTISDGGEPRFPASKLEDKFMMKTSGPLNLDSNELELIFPMEDTVHAPLWTPTKKENTQTTSESDVEKTKSVVLDNAFSGPEVSIEAQMGIFSADVTTEGTEKAQNCDIVYDETEDINCCPSIEECLKLHIKAEMIEWKCENCSKVAQKASSISGKDGEQTGGDAKGLSCGEQDLSPYSIPNKTLECLEGDQEDVPRCHLAEEQASLLSGQCPNASIQGQERGKQVNLGHIAQQVEENQYDRQDMKEGEGVIKSHLINKLPPVLVIQLKRSLGPLKVSGHVSFMEILDMEPFMDPSSEDKDNSRYRLVGVVEHLGRRTIQGTSLLM
uniref:Ubiquitinyl hydrolase 1 n=1 Tax=Oryza brachyantha TaxID=4533 RepID=J3MUM2_ORYBR